MDNVPHGTESNPMEQPADPAAAADKQPSGFASADVFGATPPKEGAEYTIKITAIDPDTREAEFTVVQGGGEEETQAPESSPAPEAESADATPQDGGMI
jgi:hypothetical protein